MSGPSIGTAIIDVAWLAPGLLCTYNSNAVSMGTFPRV